VFDKLRSIRIAEGKTCKDLSAVLGLHTRGAYHKKEAGSVPFKLIEAKAVADFFGVSIEDIFFDDEMSRIDTG
jgi:DNA-binding XRE family transcriptional regulator